MLAKQESYLPSDFVCVEGAIRPLPVERIVSKLQSTMKRKGWGHPDKPMDIYEFFEQCLFDMYEYFDKSFMFNGWKYEFQSMMFWDSEFMMINIKTKKINNQAEVYLSEIEVTDYYMEGEYAKVPRGNSYDAPCWAYLELVESLLNRANSSIDQWNKVCLSNVPRIKERPPFDQMKDGFLKNMYNEFIEVDFDPKKDGTIEKFMEENDCPPWYIGAALQETSLFKNGFVYEFTSLGDCTYSVFLGLLHFKEFDFYIKFFEKHTGYCEVMPTFEELPEYFDEEFIMPSLAALVQWNETFGGEK